MGKCNDDMRGEDKVKHFCVCFILSVICPLLAVAAAIGKEWYDSHAEGNHWCWNDIVADVAGIMVGVPIHMMAVHLLFF